MGNLKGSDAAGPCLGVQNLQMAPEDLEIGPILGSGTFGGVYRGEDPVSGHGSHPTGTLWRG